MKEKKTQKSEHSSSFHFQFFNLSSLPSILYELNVEVNFRFHSKNCGSRTFTLFSSTSILLEKSFFLAHFTSSDFDRREWSSSALSFSYVFHFFSSLFSSQFQMGKQKVSVFVNIFVNVFEGRENRKRKRRKRWNGKTDFFFGHIVSLIPDHSWWYLFSYCFATTCQLSLSTSNPFLSRIFFFLESFSFTNLFLSRILLFQPNMPHEWNDREWEWKIEEHIWILSWNECSEYIRKIFRKKKNWTREEGKKKSR